MTLVWWIALGLLAWTVVPLPLAFLIGRMLRGDHEADLAYALRHARPVERIDA